jgi:hypothetical protein
MSDDIDPERLDPKRIDPTRIPDDEPVRQCQSSFGDGRACTRRARVGNRYCYLCESAMKRRVLAQQWEEERFEIAQTQRNRRRDSM